MTSHSRLLRPHRTVVPLLVLLAACSVDTSPLAPIDGGGRADSGNPDAGFDSGTDAGGSMDAGRDATPGIDASDNDAGSEAGIDAGIDGGIDAGIDAGIDSGPIECTVDNECAPQPCYEPNCAVGKCSLTPQGFGFATDEPLHNCQSVYCDGSGNIISLSDSRDLPADDMDFCTREACNGPTPAYLPLDDGTQLPPMLQITGDCQVKRCSGGMTTDEIDNNDQPVGSACSIGTCTNGVAGTIPVQPGLGCGTDLICNTLGSCISCVPQTAVCTDDWQCCGGDCFGGICGAMCAPDHQDCDGLDSNACETAINTLTDCGACMATCALDNASETCATGTCEIGACAAGFDNCNMLTGDGCERAIDTLSDCGACDAGCARANATTTCNTGVCTLGVCDPSWDNCDNVASNGCETPIDTLTDCGGCNIPCAFGNATASCASGACVRISCDTGFDDCDNNPSNGCEAALATQLNCSMCGDVCTAPSNRLASCDIGVCAVGACVSGFQDCDGNDANGCEWNIANGACPCVGTSDSDGDGLTNCSEIDDGNPYTDPDIFNGAHVTHYPLCSTASIFGTNVNCADYDTLGEVRACNAKAAARQTLDQYAGWDWNDPAGLVDPINAPGFGFLPNWSGVDTSFQVDAEAFINITQTGRHCFRINGASGNLSCASLYVSTTSVSTFCGWAALPSNTPALVQHADAAVCLQLTSGVYPIRWNLDRAAANAGDFHLDYCFGGNANCAPTNAIPAPMLRSTYALTCQVPANNCRQGTFNGHKYWLCNNAFSWAAARAACQGAGMDLAVIGNKAENDYLDGAVTADSWVGLSDAVTEANWQWAPTSTTIWIGGANGSAVANSYVNWNANEPNGDNTRNCGELYASGGKWNDTTCGTAQAFVCEQP